MRRVNLVKACSIVGFVLAELYMLFVVLAPNRAGMTSRMLIPESLIPRENDPPAGAPVPVSAKVKRVFVAAFFFGPFGAMAGLGLGLLLEGIRQRLQKKPDEVLHATADVVEDLEDWPSSRARGKGKDSQGSQEHKSGKDSDPGSRSTKNESHDGDEDGD